MSDKNGFFGYLRMRSPRLKRKIERSRRYQLKVQLMRKFRMSEETARELANLYRYEKKRDV